MARRTRRYCILSMTVYMGFILLLSVGSKNSAAGVFQITELTPRVENPYEAFPINAFSFETFLDQDYFVNVFGMTNVPPEAGLHNVDISKPPVPTIAFLFPLALFLLLAQSRRLIDKVYSYMAFPVF
jgi:hypothetical protein